MTPLYPQQNTARTFQIYEKPLVYRPESQIRSRHKQMGLGTCPNPHVSLEFSARFPILGGGRNENEAQVRDEAVRKEGRKVG